MQQTNQPASDADLKDVERNDDHKGQAPVREGTEAHSINKEPEDQKTYVRPTTADKQFDSQPEFIKRDNDDQRED